MYNAKAATANKPRRFQFANSLLIKSYYTAPKQIVKGVRAQRTRRKFIFRSRVVSFLVFDFTDVNFPRRIIK